MSGHPNIDLFATRLNNRLPLFVSPIPDSKALAIDAMSMNWDGIHAYAFPPFHIIPAILTKIRMHRCKIVLIAPLWPQRTWFPELLHLSIAAPIFLPVIPGFLTQKTGTGNSVLVHQNPQSLSLLAWILSNDQSQIKNFSRDIAEHVSKARRPSSRKVYEAKWGIFSSWCRTRKITPSKASVSNVADFLLYLFEVKKCQASTIKCYRSMISNTLKFRSGINVGSDPIISELMKAFELQRPVQRSLLPKWDLGCVLVSLCKEPYEPLHKTSLLNLTRKTVFLLALATASRVSEIHAFSVDSEHLRFNKPDGSVSLRTQTGFLAKNQLPSRCPDDILIPNLAKTLKRKDFNRLLCPVRALKCYVKQTKTIRKGRNRLFLPVQGNHDINKGSVSGWISSVIRLAYKDLSKKKLALLNIRAHEVRALATSWSYFSKTL